MGKPNRRLFLQTSAAALGTGLVPRAGSYAAPLSAAIHSSAIHAPAIAANEGKKPLRLGLIIAVGNDPDSAMAKVRDLGLPTAQIFVDEFHSGLDGRLRKALEAYNIQATSVVVGGPGKKSGTFTAARSPSEWFLARHVLRESLTLRRLPILRNNAAFLLSNSLRFHSRKSQ